MAKRHDSGLNDQQQKFVTAYVACMNATQAAKDAGYSEASAHVQGCNLLKNPNIARAIESHLAEFRDASGVRAQRIRDELERIAFGDIRSVLSFGASGVMLRESSEISADAAAIVQSIEEQTGKVSKIGLKTHDKIAALNLLARMEGLLTDTIKVEASAIDELREKLNGD